LAAEFYRRACAGTSARIEECSACDPGLAAGLSNNTPVVNLQHTKVVVLLCASDAELCFDGDDSMKRDHRLVQTLLLNLIVALAAMSLTASNASGFDGPGSDKSSGSSLTTSAPAANVETPIKQQPWAVTYALYDGVAKAQPLLASRPRTVTAREPNVPSPPPPPPPVSTAPMTPGEKFKLFVQKSFLSPGAYALSAVSGVYNEWTDTKNNHHHANPGDFAADSGTRAVRAFTFRANSNFFEKFVFASLFRQDPRYHRSDKKRAGAKLVYAVSRVFITQGDRNGKDEFNVSFMAGGLAASGMTNLWERDERTDLGHFGKRFAGHVALTALTNVLREFIGGQ
jgi:hypothetical protein